VEYSLTRLGQRLLYFAREIQDWTIEYRADFEAANKEFEAQAARQPVVMAKAMTVSPRQEQDATVGA
jgi:hypothetical protein